LHEPSQVSLQLKTSVAMLTDAAMDAMIMLP